METRIIKISREKNDELQSFLDSEGEGTLNIIEIFTADFGHGYEVDIKVCDGDPPFLDGVLSINDSVVGYIDVTDTLVGEYIFDGKMVKVEID